MGNRYNKITLKGWILNYVAYRTILWFGKNNPGYAIRQAVFVHEQGFDPNLEFDEKDMTAFHVLVFSDSVPVAVGRFYHGG